VRLAAGGEGVPTALALHPNFPNPFNPSTTIAFDLERDGIVKLQVYDMAGRLVRELGSHHYTAGRYRVVWDGCDDQGNGVASGAYFYRLQTETRTLAHKMLLVK
jgi:flagellar hook assembly protein FlgD